MKHRRAFIKTTSTAMLALCMAPAVTAGAPRAAAARRGVMPLSDLHCGDFAKLLKTSFSVTDSAGNDSSLYLAKTQDLSASLGGENFSLMFRGPSSRRLSQGTYEFGHRRHGTFPMFIVPMLGDGRHAYYEAVFNRLG